MKRIALLIIALSMGFLGTNNDLNGQTKVFDQTITWEHPPYEYGGYGFYWWHRTDGYSNINYGNMPSDNWSAYYGGEFTLSVEVISQPTNEPFYLQFGIWGDKSKGSLHTETVASRKSVSGGAGSSGSYSLGSPSGWWNKQPSDPLDFSRADDFYRIGVVLWDGASTCIPMGTDWSSNGCPENADKYFPMTVKIRVYASTGGSVPPPTLDPPNYSVDYWGERTNKVISSDDQYSYNSDFSTAYDGTNAYLSLTPGTDVYFRKKSDYSKKQTLTVPGRPAAPSFGIDYLNERTSTTVSSDYQYSSSSDMSSPSTGNGSFVSLSPGSNIYFRKLAVSSEFASNIQELVFPASLTAPNYSIDYWGERTNKVISSDDQYSYNSDFSTAYDGTNAYLDFTPGTDVYFRKKADYSKKQTLSVPSRPGAPGFEIDYINQRTSETVSDQYKYSSSSNMSSSTTGDGSHVSLTPGSNKYFRKNANSSAFTSNIQTLTVPGRPSAPGFGIDYLNERTSTVIDNSYAYASLSDMSDAVSGTGEYLALSPGTIRYFLKKATSSAFISSNQTLVVPARPSASSFEIDYIKEELSTPIGAGYLYGNNPDMSTATQGTGKVVQLTPGVNMYIQAVASSSKFVSEIQTLISPARLGAPIVEVNFVTESTENPIAPELQYSVSSGFGTVGEGTGVALNLVPGEDLYFRYIATPTSYSSEVFQLFVPQRPVISSLEFGSTTSYPFIVDISFNQEITSMENSDFAIVNAQMKELKLKSSGTNETVFEGQVYSTANDIITISVPANATTEGNFVSNSFNVSFIGLLPGVGVELLGLNSFTVYPNPGEGVFHINVENFDTHADYKVQCCSITGEVVHVETFFGSNNVRLDLSGLSNGIYLMQLYIDDQMAGVTKLIIK